MTDVHWTINTRDDGDVTVDAVKSPRPTFRVGNEVEVSCLFHNGSHVSNYRTLRDYVEYINDDTVVTGVSVRNVPFYRQTIHPQAPFGDLLVKLKPSSNVDEAESYWAVLVGGSDETAVVGGGETLNLTFYILAPLSAYSSRTAVSDDLEVET